MPAEFYIPPMRDACWEDAAWRTRTLIDICRTHALDADGLSDVTASARNTCRFWLSEKHRSVIPAPVLRGLLYDLNRRVVA